MRRGCIPRSGTSGWRRARRVRARRRRWTLRPVHQCMSGRACSIADGTPIALFSLGLLRGPLSRPQGGACADAFGDGGTCALWPRRLHAARDQAFRSASPTPSRRAISCSIPVRRYCVPSGSMWIPRAGPSNTGAPGLPASGSNCWWKMRSADGAGFSLVEKVHLVSSSRSRAVIASFCRFRIPPPPPARIAGKGVSFGGAAASAWGRRRIMLPRFRTQQQDDLGAVRHLEFAHDLGEVHLDRIVGQNRVRRR